jgi:hypothetical protein
VEFGNSSGEKEEMNGRRRKLIRGRRKYMGTNQEEEVN